VVVEKLFSNKTTKQYGTIEQLLYCKRI